MYERILVPTDGSEYASGAGARATHLATAFDATVSLLNVIDLDAEAGPFSAGGVGEEYVERLKDEGRETLADTASTLDREVQTEVVTGRPAEAILESAMERDVDLIAMGTRGKTGVQRYVMGSVTERVVSLAEMPVLTVNEPQQGGAVPDYEDVLLPTDGSEAALAAVDHGLAIADRFDARVHAVNVVHTPAATASADRSLSPEVMASLESAGEEVVSEVAARAEEAGVEVVTAVREGTTAETLLDYADEGGIDLITMGTAGRTGLSRYLLGSTTERVIRHAEPPVLAVNARHLDAE